MSAAGAALYEIGEKNVHGNVLHGDVITHDTTNCLISSQSRLVSVAGLSDLIISETPDAIMICPREQSQYVKNLHTQLVEAQRVEATSPVCQHTLTHRYDRAAQRRWYREWLTQTVLPHWSITALSPDTGGSFEACDYDGNPLTDLNVRLRVHARQVYSFAFAADQLDWAEGVEALKKPLAHLLKTGRKADGGFGHIYKPDGSWAKDNSDTYDHAFVLMALAWAYKVTGDEALKQEAEQTLGYLQSALKHSDKGYLEGLPAFETRRANPHMHLLEAALAWTDLHGSEPFADLADEIVDLFSNHFYRDGLLREYFHDDLSLNDSTEALALVEPGHLYEWAFLLNSYHSITGKTTPLTEAMVAFADKYGWNQQTGLVVDQCHPNGESLAEPTSRMWPQTEYVRLNLTYGSRADIEKALQHLQTIRMMYLEGDDLTRGMWRDKLDHAGQDISPNAPASTLYHIIGMIGAI
ncbi:AGE family epimerase/isomerase [Litorimonas sp. RW-G-Af-16]|uniref:AGE family epimerase/isomerase n=1 Tax=Litorimonas sp. RW-G-Af-16 TaxID=3241168 RepID=UPI003AAFB1E9